MRYQLKKVWSDVTSGGPRTLLMIFALILGVWGLGSVAVSARILGTDLRANFLGTSPPHAVVTLTEPGSFDPAALGAGVEAAEYRDLALLRIEVRPDEWIPLWLFAVQDFGSQAIARIIPQSGAAIPPPGTMLIERDGLLISDLQTGSVARVRSGSTMITIPVSGVGFDPAQAPATQDHFIYAYTDPATWTQVTGRAPNTRLLVRIAGAQNKAEVERALAPLSLAPDMVSIPDFEKHPHQWQLDLLMGIIGSVGFLSFLLSSVMVGQVVAALLAKQTRQIGILKALGASRGRITALYALYLGMLALAAGVISVPLAILTGQAFAAFVAGVLNFEILTQALPVDTLLLLVSVAVSLPFFFAAPTVYRAGRLAVRQALADTGTTVSARGPTKGPWALRNLLRRPGRALVVVGTIALGVALFSTGFNIRESLAQFLNSTRDAMRFDLQVVLSQAVPRSDLEEPFRTIPGIAATEVWTGGRGELQSRVASLGGGAGVVDATVGIVALPWNTTMAFPRLLEGRWLTSADQPEVLLNQNAFVRFGHPPLNEMVDLGIGGQLRQARLVGVIEEIDRPKVYLSEVVWARWADPQLRGNTLSIVAQDRSYNGVMALKKKLEGAVAESDLKVLYVISQAERTKIVADHLDILLSVLLLLAFLVLWVAALGTAAASSITVMERTREIGILRAIGAGPRRIVGMFVTEGMITAMAGLVLGLVAAWPLSLVASSFFGTLMLGGAAVLRFAWNPLGTAITVAVSLVFGWLANRTPARGATRISTRKALAYE